MEPAISSDVFTFSAARMQTKPNLLDQLPGFEAQGRFGSFHSAADNHLPAARRGIVARRRVPIRVEHLRVRFGETSSGVLAGDVGQFHALSVRTARLISLGR